MSYNALGYLTPTERSWHPVQRRRCGGSSFGFCDSDIVGWLYASKGAAASVNLALSFGAGGSPSSARVYDHASRGPVYLVICKSSEASWHYILSAGGAFVGWLWTRCSDAQQLERQAFTGSVAQSPATPTLSVAV